MKVTIRYRFVVPILWLSHHVTFSYQSGALCRPKLGTVMNDEFVTSCMVNFLSVLSHDLMKSIHVKVFSAEKLMC